jgi:hypothetical protein
LICEIQTFNQLLEIVSKSAKGCYKGVPFKGKNLKNYLFYISPFFAYNLALLLIELPKDQHPTA